jgi:hypothetical protein
MPPAEITHEASGAPRLILTEDYIKGTYGSPCGAWAHEEATGWY